MLNKVTKSQLGELALYAAINIEQAQTNPNVELNQLDAFIRAVSDQFSNDKAEIDLRDATMYPYYFAALAKVNENETPTRTEFPQLLSKMLRKHIGPEKDINELERTKQFCLAFHEAMIRAIQHNIVRADIFDGRVR